MKFSGEWLLFGAYLGDKDNQYGIRERVSSSDFTDKEIVALVKEIEDVTNGIIKPEEMTLLPSLLNSLNCPTGVKAMDGIEQAVKEKTEVNRFNKLYWMSGFVKTKSDIEQAVTQVNEFMQSSKSKRYERQTGNH